MTDGDDAAGAAAGVGRRGRERPPRRAQPRPDRPHGAGAGRVRRRRASSRLGRPRRRAADRGRRQRVLLPGARGAARPGRGLPLHDADLRRGRRVRRAARAPARDAAQPGAARQVHAGPRRHHRRRGRADGGRLGRRGRDRPARLVRRADHLHVLGLPHRHALPHASSTAASPGCTTTSSRAPTRSPTSTPTRDIESFRRRDAARVALVELVRGHHGAPGRRARRRPTARRDLLDVLMSIQEEDGSPRFSADTVTGMFISMMFAGHHTTSGTAAWTLIELLRHPDELRGGERRSSTSSTPTARRSASRRCARSRGSSRRSRRRCACTRR